MREWCGTLCGCPAASPSHYFCLAPLANDKTKAEERKKMKDIWHEVVRAGQLCQSCTGAKLWGWFSAVATVVSQGRVKFWNHAALIYTAEKDSMWLCQIQNCSSLSRNILEELHVSVQGYFWPARSKDCLKESGMQKLFLFQKKILFKHCVKCRRTHWLK